MAASIAIHWFRRDLRIADNTPLNAAAAAPYFRIQNPWSQARRFDPDGDYIRRWVPELRDVPGARLCEPPAAPRAKGYPLPMVDHAAERDLALEMFRRD